MENEIKSKTQKKNEDKLLQKLGAQLVNLSFDQINQIDMPSELREALALAQNITAHGARRRQIKHIGGLLRQIDMTLYPGLRRSFRGEGGNFGNKMI